MTDKPLPPAMHPLRPWLMLAAGYGLFFYVFLQRTAPSVMTTELMRDFDVTASALSNLSAFYFWSYVAVQIPVGLAVDRWGPRRVFAWSAAAGGVGGFLFAAADVLSLAGLGRLLVGAGGGVVFVCTLKVATDWFPAHRLAMLTGGLMMFGMLGGVAGQAPLAILMDSYGWRTTMGAGAVVALVLAVAAWFIVKDRPPPSGGESGVSLLSGLERCLGRPQTWLVAGYMLFLLPPMFAFGSLWGVPYLMQIHGFTRPDAAFAVSLILIGWGGLAPVVGWLSDRWRRRKPAMIAAALGNVATMTALFRLDDPSAGAIYAILAVNGVFSAGMVVSFATGREHNDPRDAGAAMAIVNVGVIGSGAISQPLIGWLLDRYWSGGMIGGVRVYDQAAYDGAFWVFPASCVIAALIACFMRETGARAQVSAS